MILTGPEKLKVPLRNFSYAQYLAQLIEICEARGIKPEVIGYESYEKVRMTYPIYFLNLNPDAKKVFTIITGVHGYEIAGPLSILNLLRHSETYLHPDVNYRIYPLVNPTSFDLRQRFDDDNVDLNRMYSQNRRSPKYHEVELIYESLKAVKSDAAISMHEDTDFKHFYMYGEGTEVLPIYKSILQNVSRVCKITNKKEIYGDRLATKGLILSTSGNFIENYLYTHKMTKFCVCTETPALAPIYTRIKANLLNIHTINNYILQN